MSDEPALGAQMIRALKKYEEENGHLLELIDRLINAGVERWHIVGDGSPSLAGWLELSEEEYAAWVEGGANGLSLHLMQDTHTVPIRKPACPECGESARSTAYTSTYVECSCRNNHTWRISG